MSRVMAHALQQLCLKNSWSMQVYASHDRKTDLMPQYVPSANYKAFNRNRIKYVLASLKGGLTADVVILTHVNLSLIGCILHLLNPGCKIWLVAHGIEVWQPLKFWKKLIWKNLDTIICVSRFTRQKVIELHRASPDKCFVLNNTLDPFIKLPVLFNKPSNLLERYHLNTSDKVIFTLTRIAATEKFKGYEQVIKAVSNLKQNLPNIRYILAGPCNGLEKIRIQQLITDYGLEKNFILTGYINESELTDHFLLADLFVLPSKKEGFGIVFIEAMALGLPVICGNVDGSTDAVRNEKMGTAIDPDDLEALEQAILSTLARVLTDDERRNIQHQCLKHFNEQDYMKTLEKLINDEGIA